VTSDEANRNLDRNRVGANASYSFLSGGRLPPAPMATAHASRTAPRSPISCRCSRAPGVDVLILALVVVTTIVVTALSPKWYRATTRSASKKPEAR